jgi:predicted hydrocarbon binding protein
MPAALHRTLVPALQKFAGVAATDTDVAFDDSPFCHPGGDGNCCEFLTGFIQGFLDAGPSTQNTQVIETACRASGAPRCTYTIVTTGK